MVEGLWRPGIPLLWIFEDVLSGQNESHVHVFVADVVKSFDTVDRGVLDLVLGGLRLPVGFRRAYFGYHANVRLRFKLACVFFKVVRLACFFGGLVPSLVQGFGVYPWRLASVAF